MNASGIFKLLSHYCFETVNIEVHIASLEGSTGDIHMEGSKINPVYGWSRVTVGWIIGLALGSLNAALAWLWQGNPYLGLVVGLALMLNTIVAVSIGGTVPLLLRRWGLDPALASGPILTTGPLDASPEKTEAYLESWDEEPAKS